MPGPGGDSVAAAASLIRVMVVDDVADLRENLIRLLELEDDIQVVAAAADGRLAVEAARRWQPDVVLMDVSMPTMDGIAATEAIRAACPAAQVVMMSIHDEPTVVRETMLAGAREFLTKPFGGDALVTAVRRVAERGRRDRAAAEQRVAPAAPRGGHLVTLFSPKGGVGRTTIACNLAVALRQATGRRVVLVDCNLQFGDVAVTLDVRPTKTIVDMLPHIADLDADLIRDIVLPHGSGVDLLLAPPRPEMAELVTAEYLKRVLSRLRDVYDYVVVDTAPSFSDPMLAALDLSDQILVPITVEMPAVKNARLFLGVAEQLGYGREKVALVLNRADSTGGIEVGEIEQALGQPIPVRIVSDGRLVTYALNQGEPFVQSSPNAEISRGVQSLAMLVRQVAEPTAAPAPVERGGWLSGLARLLPGSAARRSATA